MSRPHFNFEGELWNQGLTHVAGCDEVGRGCLAGPVVTGVVVFKPHTKIHVIIDDSKKLTSKQREISAQWIYQNALCYSIGVGSVNHINKKGIVAATNFAHRSAINAVQTQLRLPIQYLLTDAFYIPKIRRIPKEKQLPTVRGDSQSLSIAAASIIAKVYRDQLMHNLSTNKMYHHFLWHKNKGYGTKEHRQAILIHGATKYHRSLLHGN